jgi:AcrR family transcriptional regulator
LKSQNKIESAAKKPGRREEKADETRRALFTAAAIVVGKDGYERASIVKITALAGVANGTFYNYFATRQELFDQLLPTIGEQLLEHIRARITRGSSGLERERRRMEATFEFFQRYPGFIRILNEAEVYAPSAFKKHIKRFAEDYEQSLRIHLENGELGPFRESELKTIVYILMGARSYLMMLAGHESKSFGEDAARSVIDTYVGLLRHGLFAPEKPAQASLPRDEPSQ